MNKLDFKINIRNNLNLTITSPQAASQLVSSQQDSTLSTYEPRVFNESVLTTYQNLKNFFNRSNSIQKVLNKKNKPYSGVPIPIEYNLEPLRRGGVCQAITAPFRLILCCFFRVAAAGFKHLHCSQAAKNMKNWSVHLWIGFNAFSHETTKISKIIPSVNEPNQNGKIVDEHPPIPESRVDAQVKEASFCLIDHEIRFNHFQGICRGMSQWFLYLYLQTKDQFSSPRAHMAALGKQFKKGGGMDPTLLQSFHLGEDLLNLKMGSRSKGAPCNALIKRTSDQWRSNASISIGQLNTLPSGAYRVRLPCHSTVFIKINEEVGYFFDPNYGIIEIQGRELAEKLYDIVSNIVRDLETGKVEINRALNLNIVRFHPVSLR